MIRKRLDEQLNALNTSLVEMGTMVENSIEQATTALLERDIQLSEEVIESDYKIDKKEKEIEALCMKLLISQQPVARDLRQVSVALKMITDMERIADHAADISEINTFLADNDLMRESDYIQRMANATIRMVNLSIDAYVKQDSELAKAVIKSDDEIDALFRCIRAELILLIHENPSTGEHAFDLMQVAKYYERIGDHATNIAHWVIYSVSGKYAKKKPQAKR